VSVNRHLIVEGETGTVTGNETSVVEDYVQQLMTRQNELVSQSKEIQRNVIEKRLARNNVRDCLPNIGNFVLVSIHINQWFEVSGSSQNTSIFPNLLLFILFGNSVHRTCK
jgi:hypothetical protein